ncbi:MAG: hypothetical protein AAB074_11015 [Planctomycetota bacterium]
MKRPWFAIAWFAGWGAFQAYAVSSILLGTWQRPAAFPEEAYRALIYADMVFIPLYFAAATLLFLGHGAGRTIALFAGGAVVYVMVYLLALSGFRGAGNLAFDSLFLALDLAAVVQVARRPTPGQPKNWVP